MRTMTPSHERSGVGAYLPALDGLRAIAVVVVVAYHLRLPFAGGGFIGVDLFFVLSGFLITVLLIREYEQYQRVDVWRFWQRRFQRLQPALVVMVVGTCLAARLLLRPSSWAGVRGDAFSSLTYWSNWRFIHERLDYFEQLLAPSPLRHTWSLSLEEQWYLLFPLMMFVCVLARKRWRTVLTTVSIAAAILSIAAMWAAASRGDTTRAYFGTDARAHALIIGVLVAIWWTRQPEDRRGSVIPSWLVVPAMAVFVVGVAVLSEGSSNLYRGQLLAVAVVSAMAIAAAADPTPSGAAALFAVRPLRWIGRRSYGIYLFHWPVIVIAEQRLTTWSIGPLRVLCVLLTLAIAELSLRFVESPIRVRAPTRRGLAIAVAVAVLVPLTVPRLLLGSDQTVSSMPSIIIPSAPSTTSGPAAIASPTTALPTTALPTTQTTVPAAGTDSTAAVTTTTVDPGPQNVLLLGDSTALVVGIGVDANHLDAAVDLQAYATLGCSLLDGNPIDQGSNLPIPVGERCANWQGGWAQSLQTVQPDVAVIMVGAWEVFDSFVDGVRYSFGSPEWNGRLSAALNEAVTIAGSTGAEVALLRIPCMDPAPGAIIPTRSREEPARIAAVNDLFEQIAAERLHVTTLPLDDLLCPAGVPIGLIDGQKIRTDGVHLSEPGVALVWTWMQTQMRLQNWI